MPCRSKLQVDAPGEEYPFSIPAIRALERGLEIYPKVTFLVRLHDLVNDFSQYPPI